LATETAIAARNERNQKRLMAALEGLVEDEGLIERLKAAQQPHRDAAYQQAERNEVMADIAEHLLHKYTEKPAGGLDGDVTRLLAEAGYENPESVRRASDEDLLKIKGIGPAKLGEIREALS